MKVASFVPCFIDAFCPDVAKDVPLPVMLSAANRLDIAQLDVPVAAIPDIGGRGASLA
jgi:hypothetical protein